METNVPKISNHPLLPPPIHSRSFGPGPSHWPSSNSIYTGPDESNVTLRLWMHRKRSPWFEIKVCSFTMGGRGEESSPLPGSKTKDPDAVTYRAFNDSRIHSVRFLRKESQGREVIGK
ncbi:hypothetical protein TNIN_186351 [Trichonephila inaurata madagascariensis]|uniref:Uncharacterized protein n=1 Tax=Trichonephila inaurata madagascariensis TaxID=2747483 RepID=A0A8X6XFK6_9ARAC|nr:hypothetical protein TNIN_186351 [Trichonephila inaurata madagascariensis]